MSADRSRTPPDTRGSKSARKAAYFLSLSVENVRCFGLRQTLDLIDDKGHPARWTILLGDNGTGKTTLLQLLARFEPREDRIEDRFLVTPVGTTGFNSIDMWTSFKRSSAKEIAASAQFCVDSHIDEKPYKHNILTYEYHGAEHVSKTLIKSEKLALGLQCYGYGATRRSGPTLLSGPTIMSDADRWQDRVVSLFNDDATLVNAEEWLLRADYAMRVAEHKDLRKLAKQRSGSIRKTLIELLPEVADIRIEETMGYPEIPAVRFKTPYGWVELKDLGLGYKAMIAWVVDLASRLFRRYQDSPTPLGEPAVVLIDELDLHLHPKWQRQIIAYLTERFPNTQFIASAHSPLVVQAATDANIALLRREGDHVVIDNDPERIRGWRVDQILTSDLFGLGSARPPDLEKPLAERKKLLTKKRLTAADKRRLQELEKTIGELPTAETPADQEAMDIIRRAAERMKRADH